MGDADFPCKLISCSYIGSSFFIFIPKPVVFWDASVTLDGQWKSNTDHLGSTVLVTDENGDTVWSSEYTPFGQITMEEGILTKAAKFTGKDLDEDTGLYYFNARWYE